MRIHRAEDSETTPGPRGYPYLHPTLQPSTHRADVILSDSAVRSDPILATTDSELTFGPAGIG